MSRHFFILLVCFMHTHPTKDNEDIWLDLLLIMRSFKLYLEVFYSCQGNQLGKLCARFAKQSAQILDLKVLIKDYALPRICGHRVQQLLGLWCRWIQLSSNYIFQFIGAATWKLNVIEIFEFQKRSFVFEKKGKLKRARWRSRLPVRAMSSVLGIMSTVWCLSISV